MLVKPKSYDRYQWEKQLITEEEFEVDESKDQHRLRIRKQESQQRHKVSIKQLEAWFGTKRAIKKSNLDIGEKTVTAFIGPSGGCNTSKVFAT